MTAFIEVLRFINKEPNFGISAVTLPEELKIKKEYFLIKKKLGEGGNIELPKEPDFWIELAKETANQNNWDNLPRHELKNICLCLYHGSQPIAEDLELLNGFLSSCENQIRKSLCRALIWTYLQNYKTNSESLKKLGKWLSKAVKNWDWHWNDRENNFNLFSNEKAPIVIAEATAKTNYNIHSLLDSCGLSGNLQSSNMAYEVFSELLKNYKLSITEKNQDDALIALKRILEWAVIDGSEFSYPRIRDFFISSLLAPWENTSPSADIKQLTQSFLIDRFGDPRLEKAKWLGVTEAAQRVIRAWLVERALAQFLDVVDELAVESQWKYRRAFWMAYYNKGVISDAWVAFATNGAQRADKIAKRQNDPSWSNFGRLSGSGDTDHAVLILKIGDLTIADFSHNGKCRIWTKSNNKAPKPYEDNYDRYDLMNGANTEEIHHNSPGYLWQGKVEQKISSLTGIRISQAEYTPK